MNRLITRPITRAVSRALHGMGDDSGPIFSAPLQTSLALEKGAGAATFTRTSTATVVDHEGRILDCKSGEARFAGVRRVENLIGQCAVPTGSENFANPAWVPTLCTVGAPQSGGPLGRTYHVVSFTADANARIGTNTIQGTVTNHLYALGFLMRVESGTANLRINFFGGANHYQEIVVDTTWRWYYAMPPARPAGTYCSVNLRNSAIVPTAKDVQVAAVMLEDVTGMARPAPGEYVSVGIESAPLYHGANVDGVKYFDTWNLNTVVDNVLVDNGIGAKYGRRVENLLPGATSTVLPNFSNYTSSTAYSDRIEFTASANARSYTPALVPVAGRTYVFSATAWVLAGTGSIRFKAANVTSGNINVTATPTRVSATVTGTSAAVDNFCIQNGSDGLARTVYFEDLQIEDVTGQVNQNPGEYVSKGILPYPYHGTGLDGVKDFTTTNPNTVAGGIVNEAGAPAYPITPGDGFMTEQARTNSLLYSEDLTQASWTKIGVQTPTIHTGATVNPARAYQVLETATNETHQIVRGSGIAGNVEQTYRIIFKPIGTLRSVQITNSHGLRANFHPASMTAVNGSFGANTVFRSATIKALPFGCYELTLTGTPDTTSAAVGTMYFSMMLSGTQTVSYLGEITTGGVFTCIQQEAGAFASSYIPTTNAAVARSRDVLTYPKAGNVLDAEGTVFATAKSMAPTFITGYAPRIVGSDTLAMALLAYRASGGGIQSYDTGSATNGPAFTNYNVPKKAAAKWWGAEKQVFTDGAEGIAGAHGGVWTMNNLAIGFSRPSTVLDQACAFIKDVKIYKKALPAAKMQEMTL